MLPKNWFVEKIIDGQKLLILNSLGIEEVLNNPSQLKKISPVIRNIFISKIKKFQKYPKLKFAIGIVNNSWMPYTLFYKLNQVVRVHIEDINCEKCNWKGTIANPDIMDNYIGTDRIFLKEYLQQSCPKCGTKLLRPAIGILDVNKA